jgi:hypothetical protein
MNWSKKELIKLSTRTGICAVLLTFSMQYCMHRLSTVYMLDHRVLIGEEVK